MLLPTHPRLTDHAVLLRRGPDLQIGVSPDRSIIVTAPPPGLIELLAMMDGHRSLRSLQRHVDLSHGPAQWRQLLHMLLQHGLLADGPTKPLHVQVITAGHWGVRLAAALLRAGASRISLVMVDGPTDADRQAASLVQRHPGRLFLHRSWSAPDSGRVLSVVHTGTVEIDRALTVALTDQRVPQLLVRGTSDGVVLGPLVAPGATPCAGCLDLQACQLDPQWPDVMLQLTRVRVPAPEAAQQWAIATAVTEILSYSHDRSSALLGHTATVAAPVWSPRWRAWRIHPECRCQQPTAAELTDAA